MSDTPSKYQPSQFESKWIAVWENTKIYKTPSSDTRGGKKHYVLDMFPYPSGAGLHVGHVEGYTATDIYARYMRMSGYKVLHPMGFDSFGLPAENYAVKTGTHPKITIEEAIETFTKQMKAIGLSYDWDLLLAAHTPEYYKWTQWLFLLMHKRGLAYRKKQAVNWCNGCQTVLANEQVVDGKCERCDTVVVQKEMEQWFLKITDYAERLLSDLEGLDWPESTKAGQRNWIGKSEGIEINYEVVEKKAKIKCFTTTPVNFGATFIAISPEHELLSTLTTPEKKTEVDNYLESIANKSDLERSINKEKTGVFTGSYALNHVTNNKIPIYVADFVLSHVGTGAVQGCPGHDERDFEFATKYNIQIVRVVVGDDGDTSPISDKSQLVTKGMQGKMVNSDFLNGLSFDLAMQKTMDYFESKGWGRRVVTYKLRDWLISRQRFWGAPIPMKKFQVPSSKFQVNINNQNSNNNFQYEYKPVGENELPVMLPMDAKFAPTGKSPLTDHPDFQDREVDTMDTFVDSSWYFIRFAQLTLERVRTASKNDSEKSPFDDAEVKRVMNELCPVDLYVGGAEHTVLHLLYARFFTKVLFDAGYVNFDEPFLKLRHQGIIMGPDHRKMSKRWGNVINPTDVVAQYGADALRMYEMFLGPLDQMKAWNPASVSGIYRFLSRIWRNTLLAIEVSSPQTNERMLAPLHKAIKKVGEDIEKLKFNTAISTLMEFINTWEDIGPGALSKQDTGSLLKILSPFAPFITEELWQMLGETGSIHVQSWPRFDQKYIVSDTVEMPIQVNGKVRGKVDVLSSETLTEAKVLELASKDTNVSKYVTSGIKQVIIVPGRIINIITKNSPPILNT